ncbi:hypothetical protein [Limosilactobacillus antri]|uniref:hypothetical protein n=1 Tax=Limosilactobacillus antri TaxID=227943 RepID=UPI001F59ACA0|nr:hypothetical protein [Limosilactobacillus antri]
MNEEAKHKSISFEADVDNFKTKSGVVTIQASAVSEDVDKNLLADIMSAVGGVTITIEANQTELVDDEDLENDGQTELLGEDDEAD